MNKQRIAFIVNPFSGTSAKDKIINVIPEVFPESEYVVAIHKTKYAGHGTDLARKLGKEYDIVVAIGGDGTVNEVATGLLETPARLAIVPSGSGDGLARHLKIPHNPKKALSRIKNGQEHPLDVILFNNHISVNLSGIGFDAVVAFNFANSIKRGFFSYVKQVVLAYIQFKPFEATVSTRTRKIVRKVWLVAVANSSQFGNNAVISPYSDVSDGKMEICLLKPFSFWNIPALVANMFLRRIDKSKFVDIIQTDRVKIELPEPVASHIDGDPFVYASEYSIELFKHRIIMVY